MERSKTSSLSFDTYTLQLPNEITCGEKCNYAFASVQGIVGMSTYTDTAEQPECETENDNDSENDTDNDNLLLIIYY